jgi:hypothetical protein
MNIQRQIPEACILHSHSSDSIVFRIISTVSLPLPNLIRLFVCCSRKVAHLGLLICNRRRKKLQLGDEDKAWVI